jgi:hypothetical protein
MEEEQLDLIIAKEACNKGWAATKAELCARILKVFLKEEKKDKDIRNHLRYVIKYLETYKFD